MSNLERSDYFEPNFGYRWLATVGTPSGRKRFWFWHQPKRRNNMSSSLDYIVARLNQKGNRLLLAGAGLVAFLTWYNRKGSSLRWPLVLRVGFNRNLVILMEHLLVVAGWRRLADRRDKGDFGSGISLIVVAIQLTR